MKFRCLPLLIFALLSISTSLMAQSGKIKHAKELMQKLAYTPAIAELNQVLNKEDNVEAKILIGECYRKINDWQNAEFWYAQIVKAPEAQPIHKLYYGEALQRNGKCDVAKEWYQQFTEAVPDDQRGVLLSKACDYENELLTKNAAIYEVKHLDFNSNLSDFSPAIYKDGVVFASERDRGTAVKRDHCWTGNPFTELFFVDAKRQGAKEENNYVYGRPEKFSKDLNTKYHDAAVSFAKGGKEIYYTRNNIEGNKVGHDDEGIVRLKIFSAEGKGDKDWSNLKSLPFNSNEFSTAHPTLSADGKRLYFTSDMPGGFGGMDLYVAELDGSSWGVPVNLGPKINTEGNEIFPYYHGGTNRLYFSSDGQIGLGGLDVYYMDDRGNGDFGDIMNVGAPINAKSDDFGIVLNEEGNFGYFSSDRAGGSGKDDIYSFKKNAIPAEIYVFDKGTNEPIEGAAVLDDCTGITYKTGKDGRARFDMKLDVCCNFEASKAEYANNKKEACSKNKEEAKVLVEIPLSKPYDYAIEGVVFNQTTGLPLEGAVVTMTNDCGKPAPPPFTTDATGKYNFKLEGDCCYTVKAEKQGFFSQSSELQCTKNVNESKTFKVDLNLQPTTSGPITDGTPKTGIYKDPKTGLWTNAETGKPANGKFGGITYKDGLIVGTDPGVFQPGITPADENGSLTYLLHIYYDFDQATIRDEATPELEKLLKLLKDNPKYVIELGSHTDARGSNSYNQRLSQRRAEAVKRWMCDHGIMAERLIAKGYGETMPVNKCLNNIPCNEQEHQLNRRTEFKVLSCKGCNDVIDSKPNENTKVDPCVGCPF